MTDVVANTGGAFLGAVVELCEGHWLAAEPESDDLAAVAAARSPPADADGICDDALGSGPEQLLDEGERGIGLPDPALGKDGDDLVTASAGSVRSTEMRSICAVTLFLPGGRCARL